MTAVPPALPAYTTALLPEPWLPLKSSLKWTENEQEVGMSPWSYQLEIELQVFVFEHGVHTLHLVGDATLRVIQALNEVVSVLRHQVGETEECICFSVLWTMKQKGICLSPMFKPFTFSIQMWLTFPLAIGVCGKVVVNWSNNLIHALYVGYPRVEFGIDKEDPLHHLPMCFTPTWQHLIFVRWIQVQCLSRWADLGEQIHLNRNVLIMLIIYGKNMIYYVTFMLFMK